MKTCTLICMEFWNARISMAALNIAVQTAYGLCIEWLYNVSYKYHL